MSAVRRRSPSSRKSSLLRNEPSLGARLLNSLKWALFILSIGIIIWQWNAITNTVNAVIDQLAHKGGISLADVAVEGRNQVTSQDILKCVNLERGQSITQLNSWEVKVCLEKNPWVRSATVIRNFPHQIQIQLVERDPIAIWQYKSKHKLLDREGAVIEIQDISPYAHLLIVTGEKAPEHLAELNKILADFPDIREHLVAATHIRGSRWDFKMNNGMIIKLPDENMGKALAQLRKLVTQYHLWERDYSVLDMRLEDQLILKPKAEKSDKPNEKDV